MRVYQVNTYTGTGGAAIAAMRLNKGLIQAGVDSKFLSPNFSSPQANAGLKLVSFGSSWREKLWRRWRRFQLGQLRRSNQPRPTRFDLFGYDLSCHGMALLNALKDADIIHFHWVCDLLDYPLVLPLLNHKVPIVWTLHDMNPLTGGCYYSMECRAYENKCGECAQLGSRRQNDLSSQAWNRKSKALNRLRSPLKLVAPSEWLVKTARASSLLGKYPILCIPNGLDLELFRPRRREEAKRQLGLQPEYPVVLFVAANLDNPWKGLRHILAALPIIHSLHPQAQYLAVGDIHGEADWPVRVCRASGKNEEAMASIYAAADILMVPSEADNFPNVILEAMACGVPAVGFNVGGIPEAIGRDGATGVIAHPQNGAGLAIAACQLLQAVTADRVGWEDRCRSRAVREYSLSLQASRYAALYQSLLTNN